MSFGLDGISLCKWLAFDNTSRYLSHKLKTVSIPFDTDFLIAVPTVDSDDLEINEIYNLLNRSVVLNFGHWTETFAEFTPLEIYQRRKDLAKTPIECFEYPEDFKVRIFDE